MSIVEKLKFKEYAAEYIIAGVSLAVCVANWVLYFKTR
jgi:hypothetical protein